MMPMFNLQISLIPLPRKKSLELEKFVPSKPNFSSNFPFKEHLSQTQCDWFQKSNKKEDPIYIKI